MIGTKIYKNDMSKYTKIAIWCNQNNATIEDKGDYYEVAPIPAPALDELKAKKITEFKSIRDAEEVKPIEYNDNLFDYDDKARDRINSAIIALSITGQSIEWTTADNINVLVTADDLRGVVAAVALRSNELHVKYRQLKEQVEACKTKEEVEQIAWKQVELSASEGGVNNG